MIILLLAVHSPFFLVKSPASPGTSRGDLRRGPFVGWNPVFQGTLVLIHFAYVHAQCYIYICIYGVYIYGVYIYMCDLYIYIYGIYIYVNIQQMNVKFNEGASLILPSTFVDLPNCM